MRIKLKYADVDTFIQRYSVNISRGGIFIATRTPKPVGTVLRFEFQLQSSLPVIRGEGQVIWVKPYDPDNPKRVHGMGVRFTRLDAESRQIIDRALLWKKEHEGAAGGEPSREDEELVETSGGMPLPERIEQPSDPPRAPQPPWAGAPGTAADPGERSDAELSPQVEVVAQGEPEPLPAPPVPAQEPGAEQEIIAELFQSSQSQVVRAAHHIAQLAADTNYFPEDTELQELLKPLRIELPADGREAARLLRELLG